VDKAAYQGARTRDVSALSTRLGLRSAGGALGLIHGPQSSFAVIAEQMQRATAIL